MGGKFQGPNLFKLIGSGLDEKNYFLQKEFKPAFDKEAKGNRDYTAVSLYINGAAYNKSSTVADVFSDQRKQLQKLNIASPFLEATLDAYRKSDPLQLYRQINEHLKKMGSGLQAAKQVNILLTLCATLVQNVGGAITHDIDFQQH